MPDATAPLPDDRADRPSGGDAVPIAEALRALPLATPPRSAWPVIAKTLPATRTSASRWPYALATAAVLALALLLPVPAPEPSVPRSTTAGQAMVDAAHLPALQQESARLERLIAAVDADPLQPGDALLLGLAFEEELTSIDAELSAAAPGSRPAALLWQQRVDVLSRYAELQSSRRLLASTGQSFETTLVAVH